MLHCIPHETFAFIHLCGINRSITNEYNARNDFDLMEKKLEIINKNGTNGNSCVV